MCCKFSLGRTSYIRNLIRECKAKLWKREKRFWKIYKLTENEPFAIRSSMMSRLLVISSDNKIFSNRTSNALTPTEKASGEVSHGIHTYITKPIFLPERDILIPVTAQPDDLVAVSRYVSKYEDVAVFMKIKVQKHHLINGVARKLKLIRLYLTRKQRNVQAKQIVERHYMESKGN